MNFKHDRAIYIQIAEYVKKKILSGEWKDKDRIPSVRDLAISIEVNPNTITHTYNYLQDKGLLFNQRGIGYFIAADALAKIQNLERKAFFEEQLPSVFKTMELLNINMSEIQNVYDKYKKSPDSEYDEKNNKPLSRIKQGLVEKTRG